MDTTDLIIQSKKDIKKYLGLSESRFGIIQAQEFKVSNINFATIQTLDSILNRKVEKKRGMTYEEFMGLKKLHRNKARETLKFLEKVNLLIVDECHVYGSDARTAILKKIKNTSYRLYLSASPFKKDDLFGNLNVQSTGGDIFFEVTEKQGTKSGYLAKSKVILLLVDHSRNKNITQADYRTLVNKVIVNNKSRNSILVNVVEILRKLKLKSLVLFSYKEHARIISNITTDVFITGSTDVKVRQNVKKDFLRGKGKILYATNIFNKGVTLPECEVLVNAAGGKEETLIIQKKGRTLGVTENKKKALIIDFIDNYDYFNEHSFNRISAYQATTGKKNIIVLDTESEDFYNDFREFVQSWFNI